MGVVVPPLLHVRSGRLRRLLAVGLATRRAVAPYPVVVARLEASELPGGQSVFATDAQEVVHVPVGIGLSPRSRGPRCSRIALRGGAEAVGFGEVAGE